MVSCGTTCRRAQTCRYGQEELDEIVDSPRPPPMIPSSQLPYLGYDSIRSLANSSTTRGTLYGNQIPIFHQCRKLTH